MNTDIIYEERVFSSGVMRNGAHIRLTRDMLSITRYTTPWAKHNIPIPLVKQAQLYHDWLGEQIVITYLDDINLINYIKFTPHRSSRWKTAFQQLGIPFVEAENT